MAKKKNYKYIYGPVPSWRLGVSLGIDPLSCRDKICIFDCVYCQLGKTIEFTNERKIYVPADRIIKEIKSLPPIKIDYITFSGRGEPTLAKNLGFLIEEIKKIRKEKIAVITNSSLLNKKDVRRDLMPADFVIAKLDACSQESFNKVNRSMRGLDFYDVLNGLKKFRKEYKGKFAVQSMFINENQGSASDLAVLVKEINPVEIQINTPLRPCGAKPLPKNELLKVRKYFKGVPIIFVYNIEKKQIKPISSENTLKRRGKV